MKRIYNWRKATVFDLESDGLLDLVTKLHVLSLQMAGSKDIASIKGDNHDKIKAMLAYHIENEIPLVAHNGICYDIPALEKLLSVDLSRLMVIDTLALSWYLNFDRKEHGLDSFFSDYGIKKPKIDDWEGLSYREYRNRCVEDVRINKALWEDFKKRLSDEMCTMAKACIDAGEVGGLRLDESEVLAIDKLKDKKTVDEYVDSTLTFLMNKMDMARLQEKTRFKADVEYLLKTEQELKGYLEEAKQILEGVMPKSPVYKVRKEPKKAFLKSGELTLAGEAWNDAIDKLDQRDEFGNYMAMETDNPQVIKVICGYKPANIQSTVQVKDFLLSKGWRPRTFKFVEDKVAKKAWVDSGFRKDLKPKKRGIPQINKDGDDGKELCPSVIALSAKVPEVMAYSKYSVTKHRYDMIKGFLRDVSKDGFLKARIGGFTNTLRVKHRELVNLPGIDKLYGKNIRGGLICEDSEVLIGCDLSSLEDRVKLHFALPHDPEYVESVSREDYDPHIEIARVAGLIKGEAYQYFLDTGDKKDPKVAGPRKLGKTTNYACVYGAGPAAIATSAGISEEQAKELHTAYWKIHNYVKLIADEQCVIRDSRGNNWLVNPINGFCYSLRTEKDKFSTLIQGTGSYFFDLWVDGIMEQMMKRFKTKRLLACFHDEYISRFRDTESNREVMSQITESVLVEINKMFNLRRELGCGIEFGKRYSEIH